MKQPAATKFRILYVEWVDAQSYHGWTSNNLVKHDNNKGSKNGFIVSCGVLVDETEEFVTISPGIDEMNGNCNNPLTIPKKWILKRKWLKVP